LQRLHPPLAHFLISPSGNIFQRPTDVFQNCTGARRDLSPCTAGGLADRLRCLLTFGVTSARRCFRSLFLFLRARRVPEYSIAEARIREIAKNDICPVKLRAVPARIDGVGAFNRAVTKHGIREIYSVEPGGLVGRIDISRTG
jgi:hypothetical protein